MGYEKNTWTVYDKTMPDSMQPDSFITKRKLDNIEHGIESAITDLLLGEVTKGYEAKCEIVTDEVDPSIKRFNMVIPKEVSWIFSQKELHDNELAPYGSYPNDKIIDIKGNLFNVIVNESDEYRLDLHINIKGATGVSGPAGPQGLPGLDGKDGQNGKDANKWVYIDTNLVEGDVAPSTSSVGDFVFDNDGDIFEVLEDLTVHKLINIKGSDGKDATIDYRLEIGEVTIGDTASAEITSDNKLNLTIPKGETGVAGAPGANGKDGEKGDPGEKGEPGKNGKDGVGIENITTNLEDDGKTITFTFLLDNGTSKTAAVTLP